MAYYPLKVKDGSGNVHTVGDPRTQDKADKASPALTGTPTAPTAAADTDSTQIATTAFVVGQASAVSPQMDSSAAAGTSKRFARADHVHPSDTSRAPLASPAFTGTPTAPTASAGTNTTQVATTEFVSTAVANVIDGAPGVLDTLNELAQALGDDPNYVTSITSALALKAPLASPALTGIPTAPTATPGTDTTQVATTAFVKSAVDSASFTPGAGSITSSMILDGTIVDADVSATAGIAQSKVSGLTTDLAAKAPLSSPTLTGTPAAPTAAADTETTQIATTAFVIGQAASTAPADNGTAAVGTSKKFARADHVHKASASVVMSTSEPSSPTDGMVWVDSDSDVATFDPDTLIAKSLVTTKGDLIVRDSSAPARLGVGSNDTLLVADSATSTGLKWATLTASQIPTLEATKVPTQVQNARTDSYTLVLSDAGKLIEMGKATAQTLTIPTNASVAFPVGTKIDVLQTGAGETTIAGAGVTINSEGSKLKLNAQWAAATLIKRATDTWVVIGSLKA